MPVSRGGHTLATEKGIVMGVHARVACLATAGAAAVALGMLVAPPCEAATPARTTVFASRLWKLEAIAMDGSNVAIARDATSRRSRRSERPTFMICREVDLANVTSRRLVRLSLRSRGDYCNDGDFGGSERASFLALAGSRAYWVYPAAATTSTSRSSPARPEARSARCSVGRTGTADTGPFIGPLAASGTTFAYSQWRRVGLPPGCDPDVGPDCTSVSAPQDFTLTLRGSRVALPAPGGLVASVDGAGRAAVMLSSEGRVAIVARNAQTIITTPIPGVSGRVADAALAGRWLVALAGQRIWAFDSENGHLRAVWPAQGAAHVDVWNGIAVFATRRQVSPCASRTDTGWWSSSSAADAASSRGAQIEAGGIVWATQPVTSPGAD